MKQSGRLQNDAEQSTRAAGMNSVHEPDDPIHGTQVGYAFAPTIEDQQLMPDQHGFGDNGTESTRPCPSGQGDDPMNEYDNEVAHPGNGINTSKTIALRPNLYAIHRLQREDIRTVFLPGAINFAARYSLVRYMRRCAPNPSN